MQCSVDRTFSLFKLWVYFKELRVSCCIWTHSCKLRHFIPPYSTEESYTFVLGCDISHVGTYASHWTAAVPLSILLSHYSLNKILLLLFYRLSLLRQYSSIAVEVFQMNIFVYGGDTYTINTSWFWHATVLANHNVMICLGSFVYGKRTEGTVRSIFLLPFSICQSRSNMFISTGADISIFSSP